MLDGDQIRTNEDAWETGWHDGFVMGVAMMGLQKTWCPGQPFTGKQISAVVSKYVLENPAQWGGGRPDKLVVSALAQAFPCKK